MRKILFALKYPANLLKHAICFVYIATLFAKLEKWTQNKQW